MSHGDKHGKKIEIAVERKRPSIEEKEVLCALRHISTDRIAVQRRFAQKKIGSSVPTRVTAAEPGSYGKLLRFGYASSKDTGANGHLYSAWKERKQRHKTER